MFLESQNKNLLFFSYNLKKSVPKLVSIEKAKEQVCIWVFGIRKFFIIIKI